MSTIGRLSTAMEKMLRNYDEHCKSIVQKTSKGLDPNEPPTERRKKRLEWEKDYINWFENMFPQYAKVKSAWFHAKLAKIIIEIEDMPNGSIQIRPSGGTYSNPMTDAQMMFILFQKIVKVLHS